MDINDAMKTIVDFCREMDGLVKMIGRNEEGVPVFVIVAVEGIPESGEVVRAVEAVEASWRIGAHMTDLHRPTEDDL